MDGAQRILCQAQPDSQIGRRFECVADYNAAKAENTPPRSAQRELKQALNYWQIPKCEKEWGFSNERKYGAFKEKEFFSYVCRKILTKSAKNKQYPRRMGSGI